MKIIYASIFVFTAGCISKGDKLSHNSNLTSQIDTTIIVARLDGLNKIKWGDKRIEILQKINYSDTTNELETYIGGYSDLQIDNFIIAQIPCKLSFIFDNSDERLIEVLINDKINGPDCKADFEPIKKYLDNEFGEGQEAKNMRSEDLKMNWINGESSFELYFSFYDPGFSLKSFLNLHIKIKDFDYESRKGSTRIIQNDR